MASIFRRAMSLARANLTPVVERRVRQLGEQAVRRLRDGTAGSGHSRAGSRGDFPGALGDLGIGGSASRGRRGDSVHAGPARIETVEVGGRPVLTRTRPFDTDHGLPRLVHSPASDGQADPGEVAWTWVPYDDDPTQGKDRPVLVLGRVEGGLLAAQLTSRDRARGTLTTDEYGRVWLDVGTGAWDRERRPSEVRLDRLWVVRPQDVRREGAALDRATFDHVTRSLRSLHG